MTISSSPAPGVHISDQLASAVREGLVSHPRRLPPWLFYDHAGSQLFEQITELPEYYLTRTERSILAANAGEIISQAAEGERLRLVELGAGSADKTRLLLITATEWQRTVVYEPVDVSASALEAARRRIEREIPQVRVLPRVEDYTRALRLDPGCPGERRLVLYIGSSIGNFDPADAARILRSVRAELQPGDGLLLGVDLVKEESILLAAYDDAAGVTAAFNRNLLVRLNRELAADFATERFVHRALWNPTESRIEMHLESLASQRVHLPELDLHADFAPGDRIHTENSYKYGPGQPEMMLADAGFTPAATWTDPRGWFAVCLGRVV